MIDIRKIEPTAYADELIALSRLWEKEGCCNGIVANEESDLESPCFAAFEDGKMIGYAFGHYYSAEKKTASIVPGSRCFYLDELYVLPEFRCAGTGGKLFRALEAEARENAEFLTLNAVSRDYSKLLKFYARENEMKFHSAFLLKKLEREESPEERNV